MLSTILSLSSYSQIQLSHPPGLYNTPIQLHLSSPADIDEIHFTTDGSTPTLNSQRYHAPLNLNYALVTNGISYIPTSEDWVAPTGNIVRGHVIRAMAYNNQEPVGEEIIANYLIQSSVNERYPIDRLFLTADSVDFFSNEIGIYVPGTNEVYNFYQSSEEWERPIHLQLYDKTGNLEWQQQLGARIHGRSSRTNPQKSLRLYAKEKYGSPFIFHPLFREDGLIAYKRILLRAPDRLFSKTMFTDDLVHEVIKGLPIDQMDSRQVAVFFNGEYWGIQSLRERLDEQYLRIKYGVNQNNVDIIDWDREPSASEGNLNEFNNFMNFLASTDLSSSEGYSALKEKVNMESFIPYIAAHLYFANEDFPNNNVRMWRERIYGKKWNFFFYDCDGCMRDAEMNSFERFTEVRNDGNPVSIMLTGLLENSTFRNELLAFLTSSLNREFSPSHMLTHIERLQATYSPLMSDHIGRWNSPDDLHEWNAAVSQLKQFAIHRPVIFGKHLQEHFKKPYKAYPIPANTSLTLAFEVAPDSEIISVFLQDITGRSFKPDNTRFSENHLIVDTENIPTGLYLLSLSYGSTVFSEKIVISH